MQTGQLCLPGKVRVELLVFLMEEEGRCPKMQCMLIPVCKCPRWQARNAAGVQGYRLNNEQGRCRQVSSPSSISFHLLLPSQREAQGKKTRLQAGRQKEDIETETPYPGLQQQLLHWEGSHIEHSLWAKGASCSEKAKACCNNQTLKSQIQPEIKSIGAVQCSSHG